METKRYKVVCKKCKSERTVKLNKNPMGTAIDWLEDEFGLDHQIVSGRERLDGQIGWQCVCGNDDLLTTQERRTFSNPVQPTPQELSDVVKNLVPDQPKFELVEA